MEISIEMTTLVCNCGVEFKIPHSLCWIRNLKDQEIYCPACGVASSYPDAGDGRTREERQAHIKSLHDAEQAEAKSLDQKRTKKGRAS